MTTEKLQEMIQIIVKQAGELKNKHTIEKDAPVNYACVFSHSEAEYKELTEAVKTMGKVIKETNSGLLYHIKDLETVGGILRILKIRIPDVTKPERGDADFTVKDYPAFKKTYLSQDGFKLIKRKKFEMIELMDPKFNVRAYFSHPPLDQQLGIS